MPIFRYLRLLGDTPFNVSVTFVHAPGKSSIVESICVLSRSCFQRGRSFASEGFFVPHVILNARFDTGMLSKLTKSR